jgi:hypothetical protein
VFHIKEEWAMLEEMPPFMTVTQAVEVLQIGRTKGYELTTEWEKTGGKSGIPCVRFGSQKRVPRAALARMLGQVSEDPPAA